MLLLLLLLLLLLYSPVACNLCLGYRAGKGCVCGMKSEIHFSPVPRTQSSKQIVLCVARGGHPMGFHKISADMRQQCSGVMDACIHKGLRTVSLDLM